MKRTFLLVLVLKGLVGLHRTVQLQLLQYYWLGHRLGLLPKNPAAAAKLFQSCPTLCDPIDSSPPRLPRPWDSPVKNTGVGCHEMYESEK